MSATLTSHLLGSSASSSSSSAARHFSKAWDSSLLEVPVGSPADVAELEYCSALRQTAPALRQNGSLTARDVQVHLLSRHSLRVSIKDVERHIMVDLAGGSTYQIHVPRGMGLSHHGIGVGCGGGSSGTPAAIAAATTKVISLQLESGCGEDAVVAAADVDRGCPPMRREPSRMTVTKTTPLDLVQQTALLLIPELQKIRTETGGKLPLGADLAAGHDDVERQQQKPASDGPFKESVDSSRMATESQLDGDDDPGMDIKLMIEATLLLICEQAGIEYGCELTFNTMKNVLHAFAEDHWDDDTIEQMIRAASADGASSTSSSSSMSGTPSIVLDADTFLRALTSDLARYQSSWSDSATTHMHDANSNEPVADAGLPPPPMTSFYSLPSIDYTAETHSNYLWTVLSWFLFMVTFGSYLFEKFRNRLGGGVACDPSIFTPFGCRVVRNSFVWFEVFVKLMVIGFGFMYLITLGNAEFSRRCVGLGGTLVSMAFIVVVSALAFHYEVDTFFFSTSKIEAEEAVYYVSFVTGILLLLLQVVQILRTLFPLGLHSRLADMLVPSPVVLEKRTKQAAEYKVSRLIRRSLMCHQHTDNERTSSNHAPINYRRLNAVRMHGQTTVALNTFHDLSLRHKTIGSLWWIMDSFFKGNRLAWQEGLWISPRLFWANLSQWFVICSTLVMQSICVRWIQTLKDPITDGLSHSGLLSCLSVGLFACIAAQAAIAINYIPSAIRQTFQFRGGLIGSLHNKDFHEYRSSQDSVDYLFGSAFWGAQLTGVMVWVSVAFVMLLFVWDFTRKWALSALVQLISFAITITLKNVLLFLLRREWYAAFYRTKPGAANIMTVVLESLFLGLSTGYIISRAVMLIGLSCLYVSRVDTPFLAEGVGFGLDKYPTAFRTDILLHEAHRHPYMERWALLYLLKLRHGSKFGTRAGGAWRILFTLALMPWLRKYRVYPVVDDEHGHSRHGSNDSGVIPTSRISADIQIAQQQALQLELEDLRADRIRRVELEMENTNLRAVIEQLRRSSGDQPSVYSC